MLSQHRLTKSLHQIAYQSNTNYKTIYRKKSHTVTTAGLRHSTPTERELE